jgi:hypothetical protein
MPVGEKEYSHVRYHLNIIRTSSELKFSVKLLNYPELVNTILFTGNRFVNE